MPGEEHGAQKERSFEIGEDEAWKANMKRMFDEYGHESLESIRQYRILFTKMVSDAQQHDNARQGIANQALQNAVETANLVGKGAVNHQALSVNSEWALFSNISVFKDAISAAVADAVTQALSGMNTGAKTS